MSVTPIVLVAASLLSIPARRIRALANGDQDALRDWIANESATRLAEARRDARETMTRIEAAGARVVMLTDGAYPAALRDLPDPPAFLVVRGDLGRSPAGGAGIAVVGSREAAPEAAAYAFDLARASAGPIVSGLALGIDAAAHRGALAGGVRTIAYVAHGLGATYPPEHAELEDEIVASGGAVASEHLPGARVTKWALLRRDRLQAAHAAAIVLVESEADGGAMQTMRVAGDLGRARFVRFFRRGCGELGRRACRARRGCDAARKRPAGCRGMARRIRPAFHRACFTVAAARAERPARSRSTRPAMARRGQRRRRTAAG